MREDDTPPVSERDWLYGEHPVAPKAEPEAPKRDFNAPKVEFFDALPTLSDVPDFINRLVEEPVQDEEHPVGWEEDLGWENAPEWTGKTFATSVVEHQRQMLGKVNSGRLDVDTPDGELEAQIEALSSDQGVWIESGETPHIPYAVEAQEQTAEVWTSATADESQPDSFPEEQWEAPAQQLPPVVPQDTRPVRPLYAAPAKPAQQAQRPAEAAPVAQQLAPDAYAAHAALHLTQMSLELSAEGTILSREGQVIAFAGQISEGDVVALQDAIGHDWNAQFTWRAHPLCECREYRQGLHAVLRPHRCQPDPLDVVRWFNALARDPSTSSEVGYGAS